jgi:signal transduction histidine kinase
VTAQVAAGPLPEGIGQLLALLPEAHLVTDAAGRIRGVNAAARQLLPGALVGTDLAGSLADPSQLPPLLGRWGRSTTLRPGTLELADGTHLRGDGARLPDWPLLLVRLRERDRALAPFQRINQRVETANLRELSRRLEATVHELRSANLRLAAANDEVQQYARAVAHDVRTPLFTMQGFAQLLADDGNLDAAGTEYVGFILEATERLQQTTDGLLAVARLDRAAPRGDERTDTTEALREVLADLGSELRSGEVTVDVGELPAIAVEQAALRRVLLNLLVNSIRHGRPEDRPLRIEVTGRRLGATVAISVRDDGVGVDEADRERLFDLFHRGAGSSSVPGTGIGLAACRKIVTAWGGTITCEPVQGRGAQFVFTAPAALDAAATA